MQIRGCLVEFLVLMCAFLCCGESGTALPVLAQAQSAAPTLTVKAAQGGAIIVSLASKTRGAAIHYTLDGSLPTAKSPQYQAPLLIDTSVTIKAFARLKGEKESAVVSQTFAAKVPLGTLVWSEEFSNSTGSNQLPNATTWTYDTGNSGFGNQELEHYCAADSSVTPCNPAHPNAFVGTDNLLHIVARSPSPGIYTSARMKTQGLFSFQYGRVEARMKLPESQGMWPAFWLLGNNITVIDWPASGELDVMAVILPIKASTGCKARFTVPALTVEPSTTRQDSPQQTGTPTA